MTSKSQLRTKSLVDRKSLSNNEFENRNYSLIKRVQKYLSKEGFKTIHTFLAITKKREPDISSLFEGWWEEGRKIMVSQTHFETKEMTHYWLTKEATIQTNSWGIPEPVDAKPANFNEAELALVPLLVGDKHGNRIGYGGGYYDKLLKDFKVQTVGLSLLPLVDKIEVEEWDTPLCKILQA